MRRLGKASGLSGDAPDSRWVHLYPAHFPSPSPYRIARRCEWSPFRRCSALLFKPFVLRPCPCGPRPPDHVRQKVYARMLLENWTDRCQAFGILHAIRPSRYRRPTMTTTLAVGALEPARQLARMRQRFVPGYRVAHSTLGRSVTRPHRLEPCGKAPSVLSRARTIRVAETRMRRSPVTGAGSCCRAGQATSASLSPRPDDDAEAIPSATTPSPRDDASAFSLPTRRGRERWRRRRACPPAGFRRARGPNSVSRSASNERCRGMRCRRGRAGAAPSFRATGQAPEPCTPLRRRNRDRCSRPLRRCRCLPRPCSRRSARWAECRKW